MIRFGLKCLCIFGLISTLCGAPTSNGVHRVSRQDFTSNGDAQGAPAQYQRPFESQNGVYRVQRQDFTNANDIPFQNSYQSPYVNRFSMYNSGLGNTNRSYSPFPKLFVPANPPRPTNPYLAIGLPNYNRVVPASSFQAKTRAPPVTVYEDDSVLPALPHPPRYDLPSVSDQSKSSSFEEDFSSVVEQFDMTEDRKAICKGPNCRKFNPNDDADAVKPIRRRRSIDSDPYLELYGGKPNPYYRPTRRYHWSRYFDDYEYDSIRPPRVHLMHERIPYAKGMTTPEPITIESEVSTEQTETSPLGADSINYEAGFPYSVIREPTSTTTPPTPPGYDCNTESGDREFTDEFSQQVDRSEEPTTPTSKPNELELEYSDSYAPLPTINFVSAIPRDLLVVDYPTGDDVPEDHSIRTTESFTESDPNIQDVDFEFASNDWQSHRESVEPKTETDVSGTQTEATSEAYSTEEQPESVSSDDLPGDHQTLIIKVFPDPWVKWYFLRGTIQPSIEPDDSENPTDSNSETITTEQPENPTSSDNWPEDHSIHAREPSSAPDFDVYGKNIEFEIFEQRTEPETETTTIAEIETVEPQTIADIETIEPETVADIETIEPETVAKIKTTKQQPEYSTSNNYWPEDHSNHAEESSTDSDPNRDVDGIIDFAPIECEFFKDPTEPVTEAETTPETKTDSEAPEQQTESSPSPNNPIQPYSFSTLIILCSSWPEKYDKKLTEVYNPREQSWTSLCSYLHLNDLKDGIEAETEATRTTTEAIYTGPVFDDSDFDESEIFGIGVETIGEDFQNLLDVIETLQIGNGGGDIWPELSEINDYDGGNSAPAPPSPTADTSPEVIKLEQLDV